MSPISRKTAISWVTTSIARPSAAKEHLFHQLRVKHRGRPVKQPKLFKVDVDPNGVVAFIVEPLQGEGGFYEVPRAFLQNLREIADILLNRVARWPGDSRW